MDRSAVSGPRMASKLAEHSKRAVSNGYRKPKQRPTLCTIYKLTCYNIHGMKTITGKSSHQNSMIFPRRRNASDSCEDAKWKRNDQYTPTKMARQSNNRPLTYVAVPNSLNFENFSSAGNVVEGVVDSLMRRRMENETVSA